MKIKKLIEEVRNNAEKMFTALDALNETLLIPSKNLVNIKEECKDCKDYQKAIGYEPCRSCKDKCHFRPAKKEPIIGEMTIFWDYEKSEAVIAINSKNEHSYVNEYPYQANDSTIYMHAIPFESVEQYKNLIKE